MIAGLSRRDAGASTPPGAPAQIRYEPKDKKDDLRNGRLDGRRRAPSYTQISDRIKTDGWFTTAYSEELQEVGCTRVQDELHAYQRLVAPKRRRVAGLRERLAATIEEIERTQDALGLTDVELTPEELVPRSPLEVERGSEFIRSRRRSMRTRQARLARDRLDVLNGEADDIRRQIAEAREEMEQDFERAKIRSRLQAAHTELRVATYWRALTETHPEGRQLTVVLPCVRRTLPAWLEESATEVDDDEDPAAGPTTG